jgi:cobalt-zinc-cadmium efflux system membrane fusion protein
MTTKPFHRCLAAALVLPLLGACVAEAAHDSPRAWDVDGHTITVSATAGMQFEVAVVVRAQPLSAPPVTGRVSTVEQLTSPSHAPLSGRVVESRVRIGDRVAQGDPLVRIQTPELSSLQRELKAARLTVRTRQATIDKLAQMVDARLAPEHDLAIARSELDASRLEVAAAQAKLQSLAVGRAGATSYWVLAGRSGTIVQLDAAPGQQVDVERGSPVATIAGLDEVLVVADVPERDANELLVGMTASIAVPGSHDTVSRGAVELVSEVIDAERQTVPVRIRVPNTERHLRPNAYVDVTFPARDQDALVVVPAAAVVRDGATSYVFVEGGDRVYQARAVDLGRRGKDAVEVRSGLQPGERIVVRNALLLLNALDVEA